MVPLLLTAFLAAVSYSNFLLFHTLAELFAIMVAIVLSVVAWHTYSFSRNHFLMYLGIGYLWIGILDLMHTLSFKGMGVFVSSGANEGIQFWIMTRYLEAVLLLSAPLFFNLRVLKLPLMLLFGLGSGIVIYLIFNHRFPDSYIDGNGLTPFKIYSEYIIIGLLFAAIGLITRYRTLIDSRIYVLMVLSILFTIAAELSFTLYVDVYSLPIFAGHIFKLFSYWLIFLAVVRTTLTEPYQVMNRGSSTYDAVPDPTIVVDNSGRITQVNKAAEKAAGMLRNDLLEKDCHTVFHSNSMDKYDCVICNSIETATPLNDYEINFPETGKYQEVTLTPFEYQGEVKGMVHVLHDVTEKKLVEQELMHNANYDLLTDFPNRVLATDRLEQAIKHARRFNMHTAVLFIDLDNFKNINDSLGHNFGDRVLIRVASSLAECVRQSDTVARWGGDEFLIINPGLLRLADVERTVRKIFNRLARPILIEDREFIITVSIGIAGYPDDGLSGDILLSNADAAMYLAKEAGKNTYRFYAHGMNERAAERLAMEANLRKALPNDELHLVYQPKVDLKTGYIIGAEALLRWDEHEFGNIPPEQFIPLAEESGQILSIGEWVIRQVCRDLNVCKGHGFASGKVAVNISSRQIRQQGFTKQLRRILQEYGVDPSQLEIEITESLLLSEDQHTVTVLNELRQMGMHLSLDDFGTGYSSLSYLKRFPFTEIKIDRSFIRDLESEQGDRQLCKAIIAMADSLKLKVVGEGVESYAQLAFLRKEGADIAQGYLFSKPVTIAEFIALAEQGPFPLSA